MLVSSSSKRGRAEKMNARDQRLVSITSAMFGDPLPRGERERERERSSELGFPLRTSVDRIAATDRFRSSSGKTFPRIFSFSVSTRWIRQPSRVSSRLTSRRPEIRRPAYLSFSLSFSRAALLTFYRSPARGGRRRGHVLDIRLGTTNCRGGGEKREKR